jgi:glycine betaine/proline transport system ATP-binding protein
VNRLHEPSAGNIRIDGLDVISLNRKELRNFRRAKTGMVFQHFALLPHRQVIANVALGLEVQGVPKAKREKMAAAALELVGLNGWEKSYPYELSGGMQQRVGLARALAPDPEILLMDEAFSALDPLIRRQLQDEFVHLIKQVKKTILFVTHDLNEALRIATHIAIMKDGAIDQQGTPAEIVLHPKTDYVTEFVRDLPKIKFITARDIMEKPEPWLINADAGMEQIINFLENSTLRFAFLVNGEGRVKQVIDYYKLGSYLSRSCPDSVDKVTCEFPLHEVAPDTFLEKLLELGSQSKVPIVVNGPTGEVVGVVPRETLLTALASA